MPKKKTAGTKPKYDLTQSAQGDAALDPRLEALVRACRSGEAASRTFVHSSADGTQFVDVVAKLNDTAESVPGLQVVTVSRQIVTGRVNVDDVESVADHDNVLKLELGRRVRSYLPKSRHAYVLQTMKEAYKCKSADKARKRLQALVSWLERNGYDEAAGSLREGMEETLTVVKLALPALLRQSLATTNAIENLNGTIRRVSRNVKRWKSLSMVRRWTALGVVTAQKKFRRIKGYRHMGALVHALRSKQKSLDSDEFAA